MGNPTELSAAALKAEQRLRTVHVTCPHDCPDACSMRVTVDESSGRAIKVEGDPTHPITKGYLCNKVNNYLDYVYNSNRVLYPRRRVGPKAPNAQFERITWDQALGEIARRFQRIISEFGPEAIQPFSYSGTLGILGFSGMGERFFNRMGAARLQRTICTAAGAAALTYTFGRVGEANIEDIPNMEVVLLWGTNLVSTGVHAMPFINQARANGATIVAIDPRVTRTTALADWHLQPRPGTDAALALGVMKVIVDHGLNGETFLRSHTVGWDRLIAEKLPQYPLDRGRADHRRPLCRRREAGVALRAHEEVLHPAQLGHSAPCQRRHDDARDFPVAGNHRRHDGRRRRMREHWWRDARRQHGQTTAHRPVGWKNAAHDQHDPARAGAERHAARPAHQGAVLLEQRSG
jgi:anaerobic selenocysteine-containing dehydrogenase